MDPNKQQPHNNTPLNPPTPPSPAKDVSTPQPQTTENVPAKQGEDAKKKSDILRPLRTFKDDLAAAMGKRGGTGVVEAAAKEAERRGTRKTLTERERKLQEQIEQEGVKIRTLSEQIEAAKSGGAPSIPSIEQESKQVIRQEKPQPKKYSPPPGLPFGMAREVAQTKKPAATAQVNNRSKQLAELRAAEKRLAEAESELAQTKRQKGLITPAQLRPEAPPAKQPFPVNIRMLVIASISVLLIVAAGAISWYVISNIGTRGTVPADTSIPTLAPVNTRTEIALQPGERLRDTLRDASRNINASPGDIVQYYVVGESNNSTTLLTAKEFFEQLAPGTPGRLTRSLEDSFTFGFHAQDEPQALLVLRTTFFENAFAGMLEWEQTMSADLAPLFGPRVVRSTTGSSTADFQALRFVDQVIQNKDTRILYDQNNDVALIYSFIDRTTLIITTNIETFVEVFGRISSARVVR